MHSLLTLTRVLAMTLVGGALAAPYQHIANARFLVTTFSNVEYVVGHEVGGLTTRTIGAGPGAFTLQGESTNVRNFIERRESGVTTRSRLIIGSTPDERVTLDDVYLVGSRLYLVAHATRAAGRFRGPRHGLLLYSFEINLSDPEKDLIPSPGYETPIVLVPFSSWSSHAASLAVDFANPTLVSVLYLGHAPSLRERVIGSSTPSRHIFLYHGDPTDRSGTLFHQPIDFPSLFIRRAMTSVGGKVVVLARHGFDTTEPLAFEFDPKTSSSRTFNFSAISPPLSDGAPWRLVSVRIHVETPLAFEATFDQGPADSHRLSSLAGTIDGSQMHHVHEQPEARSVRYAHPDQFLMAKYELMNNLAIGVGIHGSGLFAGDEQVALHMTYTDQNGPFYCADLVRRRAWELLPPEAKATRMALENPTPNE